MAANNRIVNQIGGTLNNVFKKLLLIIKRGENTLVIILPIAVIITKTGRQFDLRGHDGPECQGD